jgi:hypothetical protein
VQRSRGNLVQGGQANESLRRSPELKEVFFGVATAANKPAKEQAAALSAEDHALGKAKSQLATFRVK